jgi:hypothetical protein
LLCTLQPHVPNSPGLPYICSPPKYLRAISLFRGSCCRKCWNIGFRCAEFLDRRTKLTVKCLNVMLWLKVCHSISSSLIGNLSPNMRVKRCFCFFTYGVRETFAHDGKSDRDFQRIFRSKQFINYRECLNLPFSILVKIYPPLVSHLMQQYEAPQCFTIYIEIKPAVSQQTPFNWLFT